MRGTRPSLLETQRMTRGVLIFLLCCSATVTALAKDRLERIVFDFPHGHYRLHVEADGAATLYYGALPRQQVVRPGLFKIQEVREALHPLLHPNVPRESWPDVEAEYGMVTYFFADGTKKDYLIFDAGDTVEPMFERARQNIVREDF